MHEGVARAAQDDGNRIRIKNGLKQLEKARIEEMAAKEALVEAQEKVRDKQERVDKAQERVQQSEDNMWQEIEEYLVSWEPEKRRLNTCARMSGK